MSRLIYIVVFLAHLSSIAVSAAVYDTLTFVKTGGSQLSFDIEGLKITYDDFAHVVITNDETSATI